MAVHYTGQHEDPRRKGEKPELVKTAVMPDVLVQAHSAIMGMVFYNGSVFPAKYRGGAFAALRGSSGRGKRTGYKVIYLPFVKGQPRRRLRRLRHRLDARRRQARSLGPSCGPCGAQGRLDAGDGRREREDVSA